MSPKIAILGAGPVGLEAALAAKQRGAEVVVIERGTAGQSVKEWGHVRMFTPFGMNSSERGRGYLGRRGHLLPRTCERISGNRYAEEYLVPLANALDAEGVVRYGERVHSVRKPDVTPPGKKRKFLIETTGTHGRTFESADLVFDCMGNFETPVRLDQESKVPGIERCSDLIHHGIVDVAGAHRDDFAGKQTLVVGTGYSGATVVRDLCALRLRYPETRVMWITRRGVPQPLLPIPKDPIEGREILARHVNELARLGEVDFRPAHVLAGIERYGNRARALLFNVGRRMLVEVDRVVASLGFASDETQTEDLDLAICGQTGAVRAISDHIAGVPEDLRSLPHQLGPASLTHPEQGYFRIGSKSFGCLPGFLIATGLHQIEMAVETVFSNSLLQSRIAG